MKTITVWAAEYNSCTFESAYGIISMHLTHEGAVQAMEDHKCETRREWRLIGYDNVRDYEDWQVHEYEVLE